MSTGRVPAALVPSSFRDPSGFLFWREGRLFRQINRAYQADYDHLIQSGLLERLVADGLLVPHVEADLDAAVTPEAYKLICPEALGFVSYPYEWCFSQLKDAALLTLGIQRVALKHGMSLKDASAYNVQFRDGRPILIDTLSFERYREGRPWVAYRQFCEQFLAPLALTSRTDVRLGRLSRLYIDGVPLDLASALLPWRTRLSVSLGLHIHAHARSQRKHARRGKAVDVRFSRRSFDALLDSLVSAVEKQEFRRGETEWAKYYESMHNYGEEGLEEKGDLLRQALDGIRPSTVWDLGANTGTFSRIATGCGAFTVAFDLDPSAVESNYRQVVENRETKLLPLLLDLRNPSPGIGWANEERASLAERGPVDTVLALGLVHHLAIGNNVPLDRLADFFAGLSDRLIIEFVPKEDSQVERMLATREDVFGSYHQAGFEAAFAARFELGQALPIRGTQRILYSMRRRAAS
jgi:ribosomal protein L11 methylase PrmA